ncbi:hypothetical protein CR513_49989, partial [Mucuna pruriens]
MNNGEGGNRQAIVCTFYKRSVIPDMANEKWRICMDYIDLNKAFPKHLYPLPSIDRLVDGTSRYGLLSFMMLILGIIKFGCIVRTKRKQHS